MESAAAKSCLKRFHAGMRGWCRENETEAQAGLEHGVFGSPSHRIITASVVHGGGRNVRVTHHVLDGHDVDVVRKESSGECSSEVMRRRRLMVRGLHAAFRDSTN